MTTVSQRTFKDLLTLNIAQDAANCDIDTWNLIKANSRLIAVSFGEYGLNGCLLEDTTIHTPIINADTVRNLSGKTYAEINAMFHSNKPKYCVIIGRKSRLFEIGRLLTK